MATEGQTMTPGQFILPGTFGIQSSKSKTNCIIIATMVMSILAAAIFSPVMLVLVIRELAIHTGRRCYDTETKTYSRCEPRPEVAVSATLLCTVLVELIVAIWNARVCCSAVCSCCRPQHETANTGTVHYVQNGQQVIIMTPTVPLQAVATTTNTGQTAYVVQAPAAVQYVAPKAQYPVQYEAQPVAAPAHYMGAPAGGEYPGSYSMSQASPAPLEYTTRNQGGGANPPEYRAL